jgi:hypothetical protein
VGVTQSPPPLSSMNDGQHPKPRLLCGREDWVRFAKRCGRRFLPLLLRGLSKTSADGGVESTSLDVDKHHLHTRSRKRIAARESNPTRSPSHECRPAGQFLHSVPYGLMRQPSLAAIVQVVVRAQPLDDLVYFGLSLGNVTRGPSIDHSVPSDGVLQNIEANDRVRSFALQSFRRARALFSLASSLSGSWRSSFQGTAFIRS